MTSYTPKIRLFVDAPLVAGEDVILGEAQTHYLKTVMRQPLGAPIQLFNGRDGDWVARIHAFGKRNAALRVECQARPQSAVPDLWLCFAPIKRAHGDFLVEKATELGVARILPVLTARTNAERVNSARLRAIAIEASEQSERQTVPEIAEPVRLPALLAHWPSDRQLMFCDELRQAPPAQAMLRAAGDGPWAILIGPEGGFDAGERALIGGHPAARPAALGPRVLRADTAAIAAISLWQASLGDLS